MFRQNTITGMICFGLKICGSVFFGYVILFSRLLHHSPLKWTASWSYINYSGCTCLCGLGRKDVRAISFTFQGGLSLLIAVNYFVFVSCRVVLCLQSLLLELGITENYAVADSEELPEWHLYPSTYEKTNSQ